MEYFYCSCLDCVLSCDLRYGNFHLWHCVHSQKLPILHFQFHVFRIRVFNLHLLPRWRPAVHLMFISPLLPHPPIGSTRLSLIYSPLIYTPYSQNHCLLPLNSLIFSWVPVFIFIFIFPTPIVHKFTPCSWENIYFNLTQWMN